MPSMTHRARLWTEFVVLWLGLPTGLAVATWYTMVPIIPALWILAIACLVLLRADRTYANGELWNIGAVREHWRPILLRYLLAAPFIFLAVGLATPDRLLSFVLERPIIWAIVMVLYPILSVYPQGIVWRAFVLHRYAALAEHPRARRLLSAVAFSWLHVIFLNPIAPALTFIGGYLFARTHERSRSLAVSSIEHALYGMTVFTAGWGWFFYHGARP
jgi:hypothetical protein